ncbi:MAG: hypothetical protein K9N23_01650 [Akkermansiaceae bacterium]|nr:hypothetical protein [Akkermansiaceae bacterium]
MLCEFPKIRHGTNTLKETALLPDSGECHFDEFFRQSETVRRKLSEMPSPGMPGMKG